MWTLKINPSSPLHHAMLSYIAMKVKTSDQHVDLSEPRRKENSIDCQIFKIICNMPILGDIDFATCGSQQPFNFEFSEILTPFEISACYFLWFLVLICFHKWTIQFYPSSENVYQFAKVYQFATLRIYQKKFSRAVCSNKEATRIILL